MIAELKFQYHGTIYNMLMNDYHLVHEMMREGSFYEHWLLEFIQKHFSGGTFVDVGANTGNHSVFFVTQCHARVLAIEPLDESASLLEQNMQRNASGKDYMIIRKAISNENMEGYMLIPDAAEQSIGGTRFVQDKADGEKAVHTHCITLDSLLENEKEIRLVKIDVEGAEVKVLQGAMKIIEQHKPELFIETFLKDNLEQMKTMLAPFGYEMKERYCYAPVYHFSTDESIPVTFKESE